MTLHVTTPPQKIAHECPATTGSEAAFRDTYSSGDHPDIDYSTQILFQKLTVSQIETLFNRARAADPTINTPMVLPPDAVWEGYDAAEKLLYLVNAERCDRGIRPLEGIDDTLLEKVTLPYARFIAAHEEAYAAHPHTADGRTPGERMQEAGIERLTFWGENVAAIAIAPAEGTQPVYDSEAKALYAWLYMDRAHGYGHRAVILHTGFDDDTGTTGSEGLLAVATVQKQSTDERGIHWTRAYTVMDLFDPASGYATEAARTVPLYRKNAP